MTQTVLTEHPSMDDVPMHGTDTLVMGGPGGTMNIQAQALANRTAYLLAQLQALQTSQKAGVVGKDTLASLNADLAHAADTVAYVLLDPTPANNTTYIKQGAAGVGTWVPSNASPVSLLSDRVDKLPIAAGPQSDSYFDLVSSDGFFVGQIGQERVDLPTMSVVNTGLDGIEIVDSQGFILLGLSPDANAEVKDISLRSAAFDCLEMVAPDNFIIHDFMHPLEVSVEKTTSSTALPSAIPYISKTLCSVQKVPVSLYVRNMLDYRNDTDLVRATIAADSAPVAITSNDELRVFTEELGATAKLYSRPERGDASVRTALQLAVFTAPNPHPGPPPQPNILLIGDSIGNRQGAYLMSQYLTAWGYAPNFIGTMRGVGTSDNNGPLGESREGWETGDFTNAIVDRSFPIVPGGEAAYLALSKAAQRDYNPFIRLQTGDDNPAIARNGYVLDFQYYRTRFSLAAPDIVIYALGTNDVRNRSAAVIHDTVYDNDILLLSRVRAAWPNAKIIRSLPGAPRDIERDALWSAKYIPLIRAMLDAKNYLADPKFYIAPVWAMTTQEGGWPMNTGTTDATTGAVTSSWNDAIHLNGAARRQMYQALSGYVACAAINLI